MSQKGQLQLTKSGAETDVIQELSNRLSLQISSAKNKRVYFSGYVDLQAKSSYVGPSREEATYLLQEPVKSIRRRAKRDFKYKAEVIAHAAGIFFKTCWKTVKGDN